jgi:TolB-like protein/Tfp pilus assembly protein PilF
MSAIIPGYEYDIFISYRQKDNKGDRWVSEFADALKTELESTFKEEISVYFDINPNDGLLETHDVDESLKDKLNCLVFIPIISRTYCDPKSFAWEHEFKAFAELASRDQFGLKVKLPNGNVVNRILPIRIHDLDNEDIKLCESIIGSALRGVEFVYREPGVNTPLTSRDDEKKNLNNTKYRIQINKVANAVKEIVIGLRNFNVEKKDLHSENIESPNATAFVKAKSYKLKRAFFLLIIIGVLISGYFILNSVFSTSSEPIDKSIAVLPFKNMSNDPAQDYFSDGMMEEILNQLQKISDLRVKARTSVEKYRNPDKDIKVIGRELGVSLILEGSVRKIGDNLRINTQLIDTKTGDHLWSEIYNGKYTTEIFEFQSNVAKRVASSLNAVITPQEEKRIDVKPTSEMLAYDLCSRGEEMVREWRYTRDSLNLRLALNLFNQALKIDPKFINAFDRKGMAYTEAGKYDSAIIMYDKVQELDPAGYVSAAGKSVNYLYSNKSDSAFKYSKIAADLAPNDPWINFSMGHVYLYFRNEVSNGLSYYQKAYNLGGDQEPEINQLISNVYYYIGNYAKALKYIDKAIFLRPECDLFIKYSYMLSAQGKYKEALIYLDSTCNISVCEQRCDIMKFQIYTELKEFRKAEEFYDGAVKTGYKQTEDDYLFIAYLYNETGRKNEALSILNDFIKRNENLLMHSVRDWHFRITGYRLSAAYALIGEKEKALKYIPYYNAKLEILFILNNPGSFPGFDSLRNEPEFKAFLQLIEDEKSASLAQVREMEQKGEIEL